MSNPQMREDKISDFVKGPEAIGKLLIAEDGRKTGDIPNGNAWKSFRVRRDNQDLGTLWDIRQAYSFRENEGD